MKRRLVVVLLAAAGAIVGIAPPCFACSCVAASDADHFAQADVVFTGRATERHDPNTGPPMQNSADPIHWTFDVESTQKGRANAGQIVSSSRDEASCGVTFVLGRRYQVFARQAESGELETSLCDGTRELSAGQAGYVPPAATFVPQPPTPATATPAAPTPTVTLEPSPRPKPPPSPSATPFVPMATPTATDDTSAIPAVISFVSAISALGVALALVRFRPST